MTIFQALCRSAGLPEPIPEFRFQPPRRWRFDWAWPDIKLAIEQEGGVWIQGRHSRGVGMVADMEKYNSAAIAGWRVLRFTPKQMSNGEALVLCRKAIGVEKLT